MWTRPLHLRDEEEASWHNRMELHRVKTQMCALAAAGFARKPYALKKPTALFKIQEDPEPSSDNCCWKNVYHTFCGMQQARENGEDDDDESDRTSSPSRTLRTPTKSRASAPALTPGSTQSSSTLLEGSARAVARPVGGRQTLYYPIGESWAWR